MSSPAPHPLETILSYISIPRFAHPAWETNREIWVHTGADKIIEDFENGKKKNFNRPIPVFHLAESKEMLFEGWWVVDNILIVEPHSEVLVDMLRTKEDFKSYSRNGRTSRAWQEGLSQRWLKIHLSPAPSSSEHYSELKNPMSLPQGEGERYLLEIGGLTDECGILEIANMEKKARVEKELEISRMRRLQKLEEMANSRRTD